jgi:hypothetical protein
MSDLNEVEPELNLDLTPGKYGAIHPQYHKEVDLANFAALLEPPTSWDQTQGLTNQIGWLGNMYKGDCVEAAEQHGRIFKALISFVNKVITYEPGFRAPHKEFTLADYYGYEAWAGIPGFQPDQGTEPYAYAKYLYEHGDQALAYASVGQAPYTDLTALKAAAVQFRGALLTIGCPPDMQNQFFKGQVLSVSPTNQPNWNEGHGIWLCGFDDATQRAKIATWGTVVWCTYEFLLTCLSGALVFITKEDADAAGVNLAALETAIQQLPNPSPAAAPTTAIGGDIDEFESLLDHVRERIEEEAKNVPGEIKDFMTAIHKVIDAAMNRKTEQELVQLFEIALKLYLKK